MIAPVRPRPTRALALDAIPAPRLSELLKAPGQGSLVPRLPVPPLARCGCASPRYSGPVCFRFGLLPWVHIRGRCKTDTDESHTLPPRTKQPCLAITSSAPGMGGLSHDLQLMIGDGNSVANAIVRVLRTRKQHRIPSKRSDLCRFPDLFE